jgi:hypothetical protein
MLSLAYPLWLLGWLSLPLIRWLHRFSVGDKSLLVSALFLWSPSTAAETSGRKPGKPDPRWRLRALVVMALVLALAGPRLEQTGEHVVDVWVDDSLSMQTLENGKTRLQTGFDILDGALLQAGATRVQLHSLLDPAMQVSWRSDTVQHNHENWPGPVLSGSVHPLPPIPVLMSRVHEHWLMTDGADPDLNAWAGKAPLSRILQIGKSGDNAAITLLSVRPTLDRDATAQVLLTVHNLDARPHTRTLSLYTGDLLRHRELLQLPTEGRRDLHFKLPLSDSYPSLRAILTPADSLPADDTLSLDASGSSPVTVSLDEGCPDALKSALRAYPRIRITDHLQSHDDMRVVCNNTIEREADRPTLHIHPPRKPRHIGFTPVWSTTEQAIDWPMLEPEWLYTDPEITHPDNSEPLLGSADNPLITVSGTTSRIVDVFLDMANPALIRQPEYLVLIDGLLSFALGRRLLDETFSAEIPVAESRIAPEPLPSLKRIIPEPPGQQYPIDLGSITGLLAALLLAVDILLVRRTAHGLPGHGGV